MTRVKRPRVEWPYSSVEEDCQALAAKKRLFVSAVVKSSHSHLMLAIFRANMLWRLASFDEFQALMLETVKQSKNGSAVRRIDVLPKYMSCSDKFAISSYRVD